MVSSLAVSLFSSPWFLFFYAAKRTSLNTKSLCVMKSRLTPGMSDVVHAKRSTFFFSVACISSASTAVMVMPTQVLCSSLRRGTRHSSSLELQPIIIRLGIKIHHGDRMLHECRLVFPVRRFLSSRGFALVGPFSTYRLHSKTLSITLLGNLLIHMHREDVP